MAFIQNIHRALKKWAETLKRYFTKEKNKPINLFKGT